MHAVLLGVIVTAGCRFGFDASPAADAMPDAQDVTPDVLDAALLDYCARIPALATAPAIDGAIEPGMRTQALVPVGWQSAETPLPPLPSVPVQFAVGYRPDGVYFFIDVADPDRFPARQNDLTYCGDGVEVYVDHDGAFNNAPDFDDTGTVQFIARAPDSDTAPRTDGGEYFARRMYGGVWQAGYGAFPYAGGYTVEAFIDAAALGLASWTPAAGSHVGIDISINLSRADGAVIPIGECSQNRRLGQFFLRIDDTLLGEYAAGAPYYWPTAFCTAQLE